MVLLRWIIACLSLLCAWEAMAQAVTTTRHSIESRYFTFRSDIPLQQLEFYAAFSDVFLDAVNREFVPLQWSSKVEAIVLPDKVSYQQFYRKHVGSDPSEYGVYVGAKQLFVTYHGAGLGTFSHEIMHAAIHRTLPAIPNWAIEGVPAFFEKFWGYMDDGRLRATWGYQNPWRLQAMGERLPRLSIYDVIYRSADTSDKRMLAVYLYQRGALPRFLELVAKNDKRGYVTFVEAALDKPLRHIDADWQRYLTDVHTRRAELMKLPFTMIFGDKDAFDQFAAQHGPLVQ